VGSLSFCEAKSSELLFASICRGAPPPPCAILARQAFSCSSDSSPRLQDINVVVGARELRQRLAKC